MSNLYKGQRVRVSYEATIAHLDTIGDYGQPCVSVVHPAGGVGVAAVPRGCVEPIDDPANDPIGTVRRDDRGHVYVKLQWDHFSLKDPRTYPWVGVNTGGSNMDKSMRGTEILGVVPGTEDCEEV